MWHAFEPRQRIAAVGLAAAGLAGLGFFGSAYLHFPKDVGADAQGKAKINVHIAGAVRDAGLYQFEPDARVADAIARAGGADPSADLDSINLAAPLMDGTQLHVPMQGEDDDTVAANYRGDAPPQANSAPDRPSQPATAPRTVDINRASQAELEELPGVGPVTAQKIIAYRQSHGGFRSVDELAAVSGIGPKKLEQMRPFCRL